MKKYWFLGFLACAWLGLAEAQIINIETGRLHTDSVRLAGDFNLALLLNSTNGKTISTVRGNAVMQWKSRNYRHLLLGIANYDFAKAEEQSYVNTFVLHLRYNYKINNWLRWEAFVQSQTNMPLGISFRQLLGTGPRFKVEVTKSADIYLGAAYMFEYEKTVPPERAISNDSRFSSYVSLNISIKKINGSVISTLYYQPLFRDISDCRVMNDTRLDFSITKKWHIYTRFNYFFDSRPPTGIRKNSLNLEQGFGYRF